MNPFDLMEYLDQGLDFVIYYTLGNVNRILESKTE